MAALALAPIPGASARRFHVERGAIVFHYVGTGKVTAPVGLTCVGDEPCRAFGKATTTVNWGAAGVIVPGEPSAGQDSIFDAEGQIAINPTEGYTGPESTRPNREPCAEELGPVRRNYSGNGISAFRGVRSIGVSLVTPTDGSWLETPVAEPSSSCHLRRDSGNLLSGGSVGPQGKKKARLSRVLAPRFAVEPGVKRSTKDFDFKWAGPAFRDATGPQNTAHISVQSTVAILQGCKSYNPQTGRCKRRSATTSK